MSMMIGQQNSGLNESRFLIHRSDGRVYVRWIAGKEFRDYIQMTVKHGVMDHGVW